MSLVKFNDRLFPRWNNFLEGFPDDNFFNFDAKTEMVPAANIEEKDKEFVITLAIPGIKKDDIDIEVNDNIIKISSEKEDTVEENEKNYSRKEYSYKSFCRTFKLPHNVKEEKIEANYNNGELILSLPKLKVEAKKVKRIKVA